MTQYSLEYIQLKTRGQTLGYKMMGLELDSKDGQALTSTQIFKRMAFRDTVSTWNYIKDRLEFEKQDGALLPHDTAARTIVKRIEK